MTLSNCRKEVKSLKGHRVLKYLWLLLKCLCYFSLCIWNFIFLVTAYQKIIFKWSKCIFFSLFIIFLLYNIVLVLPYINMHPPQVYTCSPSWTPLRKRFNLITCIKQFSNIPRMSFFIYLIILVYIFDWWIYIFENILEVKLE